MEIGDKIRRRRQEQGLRLRELSERVGLTTSFLSQIERNLASPSLSSLYKISQALEIPLFQLLLDDRESTRVVRRHDRLKFMLPNSKLVYELLTPNLGCAMEVFLVQLDAGEDNIATSLNNPTEECIYVLQGTLEIELHSQTYLLGPGDSIYFQGPQLRRLTTRGDETLRFISAITPPIF